MYKKVYLLAIAVIFLIGIGTIALGTQITIDGASVIWEQSPELPFELLNVSTKVQPRILAEYATTLFQHDIDYPEQILAVTSDVPGRIVVEYASSIAQFDLLTDGFIETGDTAAVFRVTREGDVRADSAYYGQSFETGSADVAEWVSVSEPVEAGDVLELDPGHPGQYRKSSGPCSTLVTGIVSTQPGFVIGSEVQGSAIGVGDVTLDSRPSTPDSALLALIGIVPAKVTDEGGTIQPGDLLVSSSTPGYAMRWDQKTDSPCSLIGKALEPLTEDTGIILVLLTAH